MKYRVYWTKTAVKSLRKLNKDTAARIVEAVEEASFAPFRHFKKLRDLPLYSLRVGEYRVIVSLSHERRNIVVLLVEHRRRVYKKIG